MTRASSPLVVSLVELRRIPGTQHRVDVAGHLAGLALSTARVPDDATIAASLTLEVLVDGRLTVSGTVEAPWTATCRRCLDPVAGVASVEVREVFETHPDADADTYELAGDHVDLEPMVRDAILLALPLAPLCRPDCPGPDPDHPVRTADVTDSSSGDTGGDEAGDDPRWARLRELRFE